MPIRVTLLLGLVVAAFIGCDSGNGVQATEPEVGTDSTSDLTSSSSEDSIVEPPSDAANPMDLAEPADMVPPPVVVLMSGYEAFGGYETNPSMEALWDLEGQVIAGLEVHVVELPVEWDVAWELLHDEIRDLHPRVVISTGMAGTLAMRYEVKAVNEEWGEDNAGVNPKGEPVVADGPDALAPTLPVDLMAAAVDHADLPTIISEDAGTYLCNYIMYRLIYYTTFESTEDIVAGFVHVPPAPYEGTMAVEDITDAHIVGLDVIATWLEEGAPSYKPVPQTNTPPIYFLPGYE